MYQGLNGNNVTFKDNNVSFQGDNTTFQGNNTSFQGKKEIHLNVSNKRNMTL